MTRRPHLDPSNVYRENPVATLPTEVTDYAARIRPPNSEMFRSAGTQFERSQCRSLFQTTAVLTLCALFSGCSRLHYQMAADEDAYTIIGQKSGGRLWATPNDYSIQPSPDSRLFDPGPVESPTLESPIPQLHAYRLPPDIGHPPIPWETSKPEFKAGIHTASVDGERPPFPPDGPIVLAVAKQPASHVETSHQARILLTRFLSADETLPDSADIFETIPVNVSPASWESIPPACRRRIIEFESVRNEYFKTYETFPPESDRDPSPQLGLDDIIRLAMLNSRAYQTQKERLFRVALRLSLERYDYELKASPFGNGSGLLFDTRDASTGSFNRVGIPTEVQAEALLNTGTNMVTRFANDVLLTFGGPDGFAADVSSEMLFRLSHSVFQKDVRFERLTQAERNVVYAARDFTRFRRTFYQTLVSQYYNLLLTCRQVEIDAQNYISLARVYGQREIELGEGQIARLQIDQIEQNALNGRSRLISRCNTLENAIDLLKIQMGIPPETQINIDLKELNELTLRDEMLVALDLVQRSSQRLLAEKNRQQFDEARALNQAAQVTARLTGVLEVDNRLKAATQRLTGVEDERRDSQAVSEADKITLLKRKEGQLRVREVRVLLQRISERLDASQADTNVPPYQITERAIQFVRLGKELLREERIFSQLLDDSEASIARQQETESAVSEQLQRIRQFSRQVLSDVELTRLNELEQQALNLVNATKRAIEKVESHTDGLAVAAGLRIDHTVQNLIEDPLQMSRMLLDESDSGLPQVRANMDETALAGVWQRLELMNARGQLADEWRGIKLAADDLKSVLNLNAQHRLRTASDRNRPTQFEFDESRTDVSVTLDTPLNRRSQRNTFREQLLNYQLSRRNLMLLEDTIKQSIRNDLRVLRLAREQHSLAISSSALASERVTSTEIQLGLGVGQVTARDFLEAQTAYAASLSAVAGRRIDHILGRVRLFVDLEQLRLDNFGRWPELRTPETQPNTELPTESYPNYDEIPPGLNYSDEMLQGLSQQ